MKVLAQANTVLTSSNTTVMTQLVKLTDTMGDIQEHMKKMITIMNPKIKYTTTGAASETSRTVAIADPTRIQVKNMTHITGTEYGVTTKDVNYG